MGKIIYVELSVSLLRYIKFKTTLLSGKHTKKLWNITMLLMGKSTISMAIFYSFLYVYQRVTTSFWCTMRLTESHHP